MAQIGDRLHQTTHTHIYIYNYLCIYVYACIHMPFLDRKPTFPPKPEANPLIILYSGMVTLINCAPGSSGDLEARVQAPTGPPGHSN